MDLMECVGVPEFFYTTIGKTEPAGGGCVRIYCCIERDGVLVPQLTVVMPAESLMVAAKRAEDAAREVFRSGVVAKLMAH